MFNKINKILTTADMFAALRNPGIKPPASLFRRVLWLVKNASFSASVKGTTIASRGQIAANAPVLLHAMCHLQSEQ